MKDIEYLKKNGIDVLHSLELVGDIEMYNELLETFLAESSTRLPRMDEALKKGDLASYAIDAHAMKSDSKYLGFTKLAELSYNHEIAGKENNITLINSSYDLLCSTAENIIEIVKVYLGK